ncbi:MAG: hypothetical protein WAS95_09435, partial [Nostocoides sp.]
MTDAGGARNSPEQVLLAFARAVRAAGVRVTADRERGYLDAVRVLGLQDPYAVLVAGRTTLCASPQDRARHDQVFESWFGGELARLLPAKPPAEQRPVTRLDGDGVAPPDHAEENDDLVTAMASATEVLRHRDIASLSQREREALAALFGGIPVA